MPTKIEKVWAKKPRIERPMVKDKLLLVKVHMQTGDYARTRCRCDGSMEAWSSSRGRRSSPKKSRWQSATPLFKYKNGWFKLQMYMSDTSMEVLFDCKKHVRSSTALQEILLLLLPKLWSFVLVMFRWWCDVVMLAYRGWRTYVRVCIPGVINSKVALDAPNTYLNTRLAIFYVMCLLVVALSSLYIRVWCAMVTSPILKEVSKCHICVPHILTCWQPNTCEVHLLSSKLNLQATKKSDTWVPRAATMPPNKTHNMAQRPFACGHAPQVCPSESPILGAGYQSHPLWMTLT
jgi:hypothetical protein